MTTTDTLIQRLRACPAVRALAGDIADSLPFSSHWEQEYEWAINALTNPTSPLWPYYRAMLRVLAEGRDGRWKVVINSDHKWRAHFEFESGPRTTRMSVPGALTPAHAAIAMDDAKTARWSRIEHGPDEAFLAEVLTVLETDHA